MRQVAIVTTFGTWDKSYSLTTVVEQQLKMLVENGHEPILIAQRGFDGCPVEGVTVRPALPEFQWRDITSPELREGEQDRVNDIKQALEDTLKDIDIAIFHDFILQGWFHLHGLAVMAAELDCKCFHQIHSVPSEPMITPPEGHDILYLNYTDRIYCAERYGIDASRVHILYNTVEPQNWNITDEGDMARGMTGFMAGDVRITYPLSATRMDAKGVPKLLKLADKMREHGASVKVLICNAHATGDREHRRAQELETDDVFFTSLLDDEWAYTFPNDAVRDCMRHSNMFVFPTISENNSLVLLEAMDAGNYLLLNESFPPLAEFGGAHAQYARFGSSRMNVQYDNEDVYYSGVAKIALDLVDQNTGSQLGAGTSYGDLARKRFRSLFSREWIWENQFKPLVEDSVITPRLSVED